MAAIKMKTPEGTLNYPSLFKPRDPMQGSTGEAKYECILILDKEALQTAEFKALSAEIKRLREELAKEKKVPVEMVKNPLRKNEERSGKHPDAYPVGGCFFTAKSKFKPGIIDRSKANITDEDAVWSGQGARLVVSAYKFDVSGNRGIALSLEAVQITDSTRERIDGRSNAADMFDDGPSVGDAGDDEPF